MRNRSGSKTVFGLLLASLASLVLAQPAAALNADYWRGGWRTPLGDEPHIYEFVIRGNRVSGAYCRNCSDATTIGFIDGTWDEKAGLDFTVTFANPDGKIRSVDKQHANLVDGQLIVTGAAGTRNGKPLTLVKDLRGPDPGGAPAYLYPPGTPPAPPTTKPGGGGGGGGRGSEPPYWPPGPFKALRPADVVGTWIAASFGPLGMDKQIFTFLLVGDRLRGVVCGRCDNPYTLAAIEDILIVGDTLYFTIAHEDWGESDPPTIRPEHRGPGRPERDDRLHSRQGPRGQSRQAARAAAGTPLHARRADCSRRDQREQLGGGRRLGAEVRAPHSSRRRAGR